MGNAITLIPEAVGKLSKALNVLSDMQNLNAKGVVYRSLTEDCLTLKLALAWRQNESSPVIQECIKMLKASGFSS